MIQEYAMGTWSHEPFGNDTAVDWLVRVLQSTDWRLVEDALDYVLAQESSYLEAPVAQEAVAAIEVLAKALGREIQSAIYGVEIDAWLARVGAKPTSALCAKAPKAIQRILSRNSELLELWTLGGDLDGWRGSLLRLQESVVRT